MPNITFIVLYTAREGVGTAKLFVGVAGNDNKVSVTSERLLENETQRIMG